ncbi:hypothetical protein KEU06_09725 [Pseudaminobacter sp. 19-2017]|uniref:Uncharacterized protein n=1 Tax=Pseudaminobacter soli (ex Zhang et al. 2022) TaxID=2831468 RepID=A0A942E1I6_9HYPH|nr:hypothetical protein [Pseudaminobacter soli]MBS3648885.1 hypothetical protein [Pseudaminobacter soli]
MKPESYPFLRIAREFDADYGDVLTVAHIYDARNWDRVRFGEMATTYHLESLHRIFIRDDWRLIWNRLVDAMHTQREVREGRIDWQTGEWLI